MTVDIISGVEVVHWNPRRNTWPYPLNRLPVGRRVNNFGDLLGPMVTRRITDAERVTAPPAGGPRLLTVGSIMGLASDGDVIWGTGVNGKVAVDSHQFTNLDVRAVRGPRTATFLRDRGLEVPDVFGDPALLIPELYPQWRDTPKRRKIGVLPNFHDLASYGSHPDLISPLAPAVEVIDEIVSCELVIASSLHGVIIAEAFGIPAIALESGVEHPFKYHDYFEGTGRTDVPLFSSLSEAVRVASRIPWPSVADAWDAAPLRAAFPRDLWAASTDATEPRFRTGMESDQ